MPAAKSQTLPQTTGAEQTTEVTQAPNRTGIWSRSQQPRSTAMAGPRFEQTDFSLQVRKSGPQKPLESEERSAETRCFCH